ncbi:MAG TPA: methylenetetrahydrofolate reductase [NAD(P)H] [Thermohalobaculum sp.]|nr:methylenetetrahydrofolate reductase [NAD(P)H] [Thermohalobaculum sp.]
MASASSQGRATPRISFEFFPPRTPRASMALWESVLRLAPLRPDFVSVTYGAGGTTRDRTMAAILAIRDCAGLSVAGHLTCVGATRDEVLRVARSYAKLGCRRIVALRGDPPAGQDRFTPHPGGFEGSVELVSALAGLGQFELWVACYPEVHPEAASPQADIDHLKRKLDAGASGAITQLFFENATFYRFRDACAAAGIGAPIIPGILPIEDFDKTVRFADSCGARVPDWMFDAYESAGDNVEDEAAHDRLSIAIATEQCADLLANGVEDLHFYTLNKSGMVFQVCRALGIEPQPAAIAASCG